jgi:hypothetical protein
LFAVSCARSFVTQNSEGERVVFVVDTTMAQVRSALGPPAEVRAGASGAENWVYPSAGVMPTRVLQFRGEKLEWLKHLEPGT